MQRAAIPLIARLRRRLVASAWLFAFLMLAKSALVMNCLTDGLDTTSTSTTVSMTSADHTDRLPIADDADALCAHAGAAGSHCSCAHGVALPVVGDVMDSAATPASLAVFDRTHFVSSPQKTALRPPIA